MILAPGFSPQPTTQTDTLSGGFVNALDFDSHCRGVLRPVPQHVIEVTAAIAALSIVVNAANSDPTLVIRTPDGRYLCNDDYEGLDSRVRAPFGPGRYEVFVGAYDTGGRSSYDYRLGVSEADIHPSEIPEP